MAKYKELTEEAVKNAREDRDRAKSLLNDIARYIGENAERYQSVGMETAKLLETLQRSNEQILKIATLIQKDNKIKESQDISLDEMENIYSSIQGNEDE